MSDTPRTSAWWRAHFQGHLMTDSDCLQLINQIAAEEKAHAVTLAALANLRANFDRIVTAWKREELSWDEERKDLNRDVKQLHDAAVETEGKLEALTSERNDANELLVCYRLGKRPSEKLFARIEARRSK